MERMQIKLKEDPKDRFVRELVEQFMGHKLIDVRALSYTRIMREAFSRALCYAIQSKRHVVCSGYLKFAREKLF